MGGIIYLGVLLASTTHDRRHVASPPLLCVIMSWCSLQNLEPPVSLQTFPSATKVDKNIQFFVSNVVKNL